MFPIVPLVLLPSPEEGHSPGSYQSTEMGDTAWSSPAPAELQVSELKNKCLFSVQLKLPGCYPVEVA